MSFHYHMLTSAFRLVVSHIAATAIFCVLTLFSWGLQGAMKSTGDSAESLKKLVTLGTVYQGPGNVWCNLSNYGWMGDDNAVTPSMEWPAGSSNMHLYQGSIWIAGLDASGLPHVTAGDESEFYPLLSQSRIDSFQAHGWDAFTTEEYTIVVASSEWTENLDSANCLWYDSDIFGQPGIDDDGDGLVDEDPLDFTDNDGDGLINEDFAAVSETDTYTMYNDAWQNRHQAGDLPLGVEVIERTYAWSHHYAQNFILWDYEIINVGLASNMDSSDPLLIEPDMPQDLTDVYVGIRFDGDIASLAPGTYWYDDQTAYNYEYNISYIYDADDPERLGDDTGEAGLAPGYLFAALLGSPLDKTGRAGIPASHNWWTIDDDPDTDALKYQFMSNGFFASLPLVPYDYRFLQAVGPYDMAHGDTLRLVWAMGVGNGYQGMVYDVGSAHWMFNHDFGAPPTFPPEQLTILEWDGNSVILIWDESTHEYLAGYNIYRSVSAEGPFSKLNSELLVESRYQDDSIVAGEVYYYAITNVDCVDTESDYSNIVQLNAGAPMPPSGIRAAIANGAIRIDWDTHPDAAVTSFNIYRSLSDTIGFVQINTTPVAAETYTDAAVTTGETYYYMVSALNPAGYESLPSGWVRITLLEGLKGLGVLIVDDDQETPDREIDHVFHSMFQVFNYEDWDVAEQGIPTVADLQNYSTIVWYADENPMSFYYFALPETDQKYVQNPLPAYLDMGGNLWLMGDEILYVMAMADTGDLFGAGGFARDYLHLLDGGDAGDTFTGLVSLGVDGFQDIGIPGLATGTGWPDQLFPTAEATAIYDLGGYDSGTTGGIFYDGDDHKVIFFGVNASFTATNNMVLTLSPEDMAVVTEHALGAEFGESLMENPAPLPPKLLEVTQWGDDYIDLAWSINEEADFLGYRLYRSAGDDDMPELVNTELLRDQHTYRDSLLTETVEYRYYVTCVDLAFQESKPSMVVTEIPGRPYTPGKPRVTYQMGNDIELAWDLDTLADLAGYNLYYRREWVFPDFTEGAYSRTEEAYEYEYIRLNDSLIASTSYSTELDEDIYYFSLTAVDQDSLESYRSKEITVLVRGPLSDRILLIDDFSWTPGCYNSHEKIAAEIDSGFMNGIDYTLWDVPAQGTDIFTPAGIGQYSSVILYTDGGYAAADYASLLTAYAQAGGNLLISGYQLADMGTEMLAAFGFQPEYIGTGSNQCDSIYGVPGTAYEGITIDVPLEVRPRIFEAIYPEADHTSTIFFAQTTDPVPAVLPVGVRSEMPNGNVVIILGQSLPFLDQTQQATKDFGWYVLTEEFGEIIVSNAAEEKPIPLTYRLYPCYPNPFNPTTIIRYDLPRPVEVQLVVYDLLGRDIVRLVDQPMGAGAHRAVWNGRDAVGRLLPSGIYLARMVTPEYTKSVKMVLLK